jgi:hypothetical protein
VFEGLGLVFEVLGLVFEWLGLVFEVLGLVFEWLGLVFGWLGLVSLSPTFCLTLSFHSFATLPFPRENDSTHGESRIFTIPTPILYTIPFLNTKSTHRACQKEITKENGWSL